MYSISFTSHHVRVLSMLLIVSAVCSFPLLCNIPWYEYSTISSSIFIWTDMGYFHLAVAMNKAAVDGAFLHIVSAEVTGLP